MKSSSHVVTTNFVIIIIALGRCPFRMIEKVVDVLVKGLGMLVAVLANDRWGKVKLDVSGFEVLLGSYLHLAHHVDLGVIA